MIGVTSLDGAQIPEGAMLVMREGEEPVGHVTTAAPRVAGDGAIGLGLLVDGASRHGQTLYAWSPTRKQIVPVRIGAPVFYDAEGAR